VLVSEPGDADVSDGPVDRSAVPYDAVVSVVAERLLQLLDAHRVLTTGQLTRMTGAPERTTEYRLARLAERGLAGRVRPPRQRGSAPWHWWLTVKGARLINGTACAAEHREPNPLFVRHTTAIAELALALREHGPAAGVELAGWWPDQHGWQQWRPGAREGFPGRVRRITPDATAHLRLHLPDTDAGAPPVLGAVLVEVDLATMTAERLRQKLGRYLDYARDEAWQGVHPHAPLLLVLTTTPARAATFLRGAARTLPRIQRTHREPDDIILDEAGALTVAACGYARDPKVAVTERVWMLPADGSELTLVDLLAERIDAQRRAEVVWDTRDRLVAQWRFEEALEAITRQREIPDQVRLGDPAADSVLRVLHADGYPALRAWATEHPGPARLLTGWWQQPRTPCAEAAPAVPGGLVSALRSEYPARFHDQAQALGAATGAIAVAAPVWQAAAGRLLAGELLPALSLGLAASSTESREQAQQRLWRSGQYGQPDYPTRRQHTVHARWQALGFLGRRRTSPAGLAAGYDAEQLTLCPGCQLASPREDAGEHCEACNSPFTDVPATPGGDVPSLVAELTRRLHHAQAGDTDTHEPGAYGPGAAQW